MSLLVTISGTTQITYNDQTVLTAAVIDTETQQTPSGLPYSWTASDGSFIGATDGQSVTYLANLAQNTDQAVTISCEVTLPGNPNPTVNAPGLNSLTELGITGQLVNMLIDVEQSGTDLLDCTDLTAIASGSDTDLSSDISINRIRWDSATNRLILDHSGTGSLLNFWDTAAREAYSAYVIINDGTVVELPGAWIGSDCLSIGSGLMQWEVLSSETTIINALNSVASGQMLLLGIADIDSIGIPDETAAATATVNVQRNEPPRVEITAPTRINPGKSAQLNTAVTDPESTSITVLWQATAGTIDNPTALNPNFTAPDQPGTVTITCTATDADGIEGSSTRAIVIDSPPAINITVPNQLEVGHDGDISVTVSEPNDDTVNVEWVTNRGSINNPTALNAIITAPDNPCIVGIICVVTDSAGLETRATAQITVIPNQPPWVTIIAPTSLDTGETGNLQAVVSDPTGDALTVRWSATDGTIDNPTALNTTFTTPTRSGSVRIICTVIDEHRAVTRARTKITINQSNHPPIIQLNVPSSVEPGQTVNVVATVSDPDGNNVEGEWNATAGSFAHPENSSTTFTAPPELGVVSITYEAMDDMGATSAETTYITVGNPNVNIFTPAVRIEIEGVDITDRWIRRDGMTIGKSLDYPDPLTFRSADISFNLDNEDEDFDHGNPNNFFITHGLPAHGHGAKVLVWLGLSKNELIPVFAGEISEVVTNLQNTKALIKTRDLSVRSQQKAIENFGIEITRRITDFEGAAIDYTPINPVFYFPVWGLPISRNSVSLTVHQGDNDIDINLVEAVATEGMLSNRNAEIDYTKGLIRFEAPPDDAEATSITATWKRDYRYKRPDFLVRQLLKNTGVQDTLQITDDSNARFAIEQALVRHPTDSVFSSHGRPYFQEHGITRWMMRDNSGDTPEWWMAHDNRLVKYDELLDEYEEVAQVPEDTSIEEIPPGEYGSIITDESDVSIRRGSNSFYITTRMGVYFHPKGSLSVTGNYFIFLESYWGLISYPFSGATAYWLVDTGRVRYEKRNSTVPNSPAAYSYSDHRIVLPGFGTHPTSHPEYQNMLNSRRTTHIISVDFYDNHVYAIGLEESSTSSNSYSTFIRKRSIIDGQTTDVITPPLTGVIRVTPTRIIIYNNGTFRVFDHSGTEQTLENFTISTSNFRDFGINASYIYVLRSNEIEVYTHAGAAVSYLNFTLPHSNYGAIDVGTGKLYAIRGTAGSNPININIGLTQRVHKSP